MQPSYGLLIESQGGPTRREVFALAKVVIGRDTGDLILPDPQLSTTHAELHFDGQRVVLRDLESTNGTWVNGQRIASLELAPGMSAQLGQHRITFLGLVGAGPSRGRTVAVQQPPQQWQPQAPQPWQAQAPVAPPQGWPAPHPPPAVGKPKGSGVGTVLFVVFVVFVVGALGLGALGWYLKDRIIAKLGIEPTNQGQVATTSPLNDEAPPSPTPEAKQGDDCPGINCGTTESPSAASSSRVDNAAPPAAAVSAPPSPTATISCKALGKKGQSSLGTDKGELVSQTLRAWGDDIFLLSRNRPNARTTLLRLKRDGSGKTSVGSLSGTQSPDGLLLTKDYAYTTLKQDLWQIPLSGGEAKLLVKDFSRPIAIAGGQLYGVQCSKTDKSDALVRADGDTGSSTVLARIPRNTKTCEYRGLALDEKRAIISDWAGKRILSVSLADAAVSELATGHAFPRDVVIGENGVDFAASKGLRRVAETGGSTTKLAEVGATPYMDLAFDETYYWLFQGEPYQPTESIWRLPRSGGNAVKVWTYPDRGDSQGTGIDSIAVDEQCVYYTAYAKSGDYFTVYARAKSD